MKIHIIITRKQFYITTNLLNGKKYVGSHCTDNIDDNYIGGGRYFIRAVSKYGKKNFRRDILEECEDIISARKLEEKYIEIHNTLSPNGYNLSPTGGCEKGFSGTLSEEHIQAISKWQKGKTYEEIYGEERAKEIKEKQNEKKRGRKQSKETIQKRKETIGVPRDKGKTYEELYGKEKANEMKEKQRLAKLGKPTGRKGKKMKDILVEKYGKVEGSKKYEEFVEKVSKGNTGKSGFWKGKTRDIETREKISLKLRNKK